MSRRNAIKPIDPIPSAKNKPPNSSNEQGMLYHNPESDQIWFNEMNKNKDKMTHKKRMTKIFNNTIQDLDNQGRLRPTEQYKGRNKNLVAMYQTKKSRNSLTDTEPFIEDLQSSSVGEGMSNKYKSVKIHKLSPAQQRKLKKGNKVIIKGGGDHEIMLSPEQEKKFNKKSMMGCGITIQLDPYQQDMVMSGTGFKDFVGKMKKAKIGKKIIKFAKDNKILKRVGNALVERAIKTIAGSGVETVKRKRGRPRKGGALMAAGGGGALKPAGNY